MNIIITQHAIDQYRAKTFNDPDISDDKIRNLLMQIIKHGKTVERRVGKDVFKIRYQGLAVVARLSRGQAVVITYLGDPRYQHWYKKEDYKIKKRVAYN